MTSHQILKGFWSILSTFYGNQLFGVILISKCIHKKEAANQFSCFSPALHVSLTADAATRFTAHLSACSLFQSQLHLKHSFLANCPLSNYCWCHLFLDTPRPSAPFVLTHLQPHCNSSAFLRSGHKGQFNQSLGVRYSVAPPEVTARRAHLH